MLQTVECPHCGRKLAIDAQHAGKSVLCPLCKQPFTPPLSEALPIAQPEDPPYAIQRDEPPRRPAISDQGEIVRDAERYDEPARWPRRPDGLPVVGSPGRELADRYGIDLAEKHHQEAS